MEYSKETEKFAFGIGSEKMVGSGKVTQIAPIEKDEESEKKELIKLIASTAAALGLGIIQAKYGRRSKSRLLKKGHHR